MRRTPLLTVAAVALLGLNSGCGGKRLDVNDLDKKEWVVLVVAVNNAGKCALKEKQTSEIRTEAKSQVNWIVVGFCPADSEGKPQTISIDRKFVKQGGSTEFDPFKDGSVLNVPVPTTSEGPWSRLIGRVKDTITENEKGRYKYKIRINGDVAEWRSAADDGDFYVCPVWPCDFD